MPARFPIAVLAALGALVVAAAPAAAGPKSSGKFPETLPPLHAVPDPNDRGRVVDARGREVLLRGINVNVLADHWRGSPLPAVQPFLPEDLALLRGIGFNVVRLQLSWSRIEPRPGSYDEAYLAEAERYVETFRGAGIYTIIDVHQSAWGPSLAARPNELCPPGLQPAAGWEGAPPWATLVSDLVPRCFSLAREINPAVEAAWAAFWRDAPGPDSFGIRTRYTSMLGHLARRFAKHESVAGYDVMNEPAAFTPAHLASLSELYSQALREIRAGERMAGAVPRLVFFQPDVRWSKLGRGAPPDFTRDANIVYAPHVYSQPVARSSFQIAREEAKGYGGAPVFVGEWGTEPDRGVDFQAHQDLQDTFGVGSAMWLWREGCGDPRVLTAAPGSKSWGLYEVDCRTNATVGVRERLVKRITRAYVRAAPGRLHGQRYLPKIGRFSAAGDAPEDNKQTLLVFYPGAKHPNSRFRATGLTGLRAVRVPGEGRFVLAVPRGPWSLEIGPRLR